jgi:hypothetical protein
VPGKLLILLAVLLMPFGMQPATAAPAAHEMTMPMEHCPDQAPGHGGKAGFAECTMACSAALPAMDRAADEPLFIVNAPTEPPVVQALDGLHPETATPPPRLA